MCGWASTCRERARAIAAHAMANASPAMVTTVEVATRAERVEPEKRSDLRVTSYIMEDPSESPRAGGARSGVEQPSGGERRSSERPATRRRVATVGALPEPSDGRSGAGRLSGAAARSRHAHQRGWQRLFGARGAARLRVVLGSTARRSRTGAAAPSAASGAVSAVAARTVLVILHLIKVPRPRSAGLWAHRRLRAKPRATACKATPARKAAPASKASRDRVQSHAASNASPACKATPASNAS